MDEGSLPASKACTKCGEEKPAAQFYIQRYKTGVRERLHSWCKECSRAAGRAAKSPEYPPVGADEVLRCSKCRELKPATEYTVDGRKTTGRRSQCKICRYSAAAAWREGNREHLRGRQVAYERATQRRSWLKTKYGITVEQFEAMVTAQGNLCALCRQSQHPNYRHLDVDHCHKTGKVRGLLCRHCNTAIGLLRDDPDLMRRAIGYLKGQS